MLFLITARFDRVFWKYESMGYASCSRTLVCFIRPCISPLQQWGWRAVRLAGETRISSQASGRPYYREGAVGEFVLGPRSTGVKNGYLATVSHQQMR